ncbi:Ran exchange factor Prp20 [Cordyceps militaris]|uniref:Ran exchange factor Prp20 n=1 Tax=Cordyceps militaris TaxID=73501 RepID=A0A2H4SLX8_CORMI|nr:Ran exchange factor Prp20 [Cordyceps militaris]
MSALEHYMLTRKRPHAWRYYGYLIPCVVRATPLFDTKYVIGKISAFPSYPVQSSLRFRAREILGNLAAMPPKRSLAKVSTATSKKQAATTERKLKSSKLTPSRHLFTRCLYSQRFLLARISKPTSESSKRKSAPETGKERPLKKTKVLAGAEAPRSPPHLNEVPTQVLSIFPFGNGEMGELGLGPSTTETLIPCVNPYLDASSGSSPKPRVVQVACGGMHTVVLTSDNEIITWGVNDNWALGRDTEWDGVWRDEKQDSGDEEEGELNPHESIPAVVPAASFPPGTRFVQVAAGDSCSFALTSHGLVYGWGTFRNASGDDEFGYDSQGQLIVKQKTPTCIVGLTKIVQIACGANHALALDVKGSVWGWGAHEQNQLGRRLLRRHQEHLKPRLVQVCRGRAKYIASGEYHSFAIDHKDNVWAWGLNSFGEAGYAKEAGGDSAVLPYPMMIRDLCGKGVTVLAGGAHHSAAVTMDGKCLVWGRMDGGQLGIRFTTEQLENKDLIRYDERDKPRICLCPTIITSIGDAVHVACGTDHTIFVNKDGIAYTTGFGSSGQLGLGSQRDVEVARQVKRNDLFDTAVTWAGAGGQFSILAGPVKIE